MKRLIILLPFLAACSNVSKQDPSISAQKTVCETDNCIIAFGDSITAGYGTSNMNETSYAGQIANHYQLELTDLGIGHSTLSGEMPGILNYPYKPTQTVVMLSGYNDMRNFGTDATHLAQYGAQLKQAFDLWESLGIEVYIGNCLREVQPGYGVYGGIGSDAAANLYAAELTAQASGYSHIHVIDTNNDWNPILSNTAEDLVHPNDIGANQIAQVFINAIGTNL
jgi:lysophospholipase L1-like esterase